MLVPWRLNSKKRFFTFSWRESEYSPSRLHAWELTYPTLWKEQTSSKVPAGLGYVRFSGGYTFGSLHSFGNLNPFPLQLGRRWEFATAAPPDLRVRIRDGAHNDLWSFACQQRPNQKCHFEIRCLVWDTGRPPSKRDLKSGLGIGNFERTALI